MKLEEIFEKYFARQERSFFKNVLRQIFFVNPFFSLVFAFIYNGTEGLGHAFVLSYLISLVISLVITGILAFAKVLDKKIRKALGKSDRSPPRVWWFVLSLCAMPVGLYVASVVMPWLGPVLNAGSVEFSPDSFRTSLVIGGLIGTVFFASGTFLDTKKSLKRSEIELKEMKNQHLQAQISALTAQMNPHLLFNSLNTVASLVASDPAKAEETIVTLSELYRGVLNSSKNMTHSLQVELGLCEAYLKIEKARFGDRVRSEIEVDQRIDASLVQVPSLCLQPLVENAVKHGISKKAAGGLVRIQVSRQGDRLRLVVVDDGIGFTFSPEKSAGTGTGLSNTRDRISLHYGERGLFQATPGIQGGTMITIEVPFLDAREQA